MRKVSKGNREEFSNDKRAAELGRRGFNHDAVAGMMNIEIHKAKKMMKNRHNIILDGEV